MHIKGYIASCIIPAMLVFGMSYELLAFEAINWMKSDPRVEKAPTSTLNNRSTNDEKCFETIRRTLVVAVGGDFASIADALSAAADGDTILIETGTYREYDLLVDQQVTIRGIGRPVIDVEHKGEGIRIIADNVHVEGLVIRNVPTSHSRDLAAIRFERASGGAVIDNILDDTFFGIYLARAHDVEIRENRLRAYQSRESVSANGIHLWNSNRAVIADNEIIGHRDGIYLEYVRESIIAGNHVEKNIRYGLHFMFSDDCVYRENRFENNGAGVAVMYSRRVTMKDNLFVNNWGASSYGLLLKEITDSEIYDNEFSGNTVGIRSEGSDRVIKYRNNFHRNGWAIRIMASSMDNQITENNFIDNAFDVSTNSRRHNRNTFEANFWDKYSGYDLNGDGFGDVPYHPVRLFSLIVERNPMALMLLRSMFIQILDLMERVMPTITPETLVDKKPLMREVAL